MDANRARESSEDARRTAADRLHSMAIHLLRHLRRQDAASGVTAPHLSALSVLVFGGPRTIGELAAAEQVRAPTMTRVVDRLERDGLAVREGDPADGRVWMVRATAEGERVLVEGRARRVDALASLLKGLDDEEVRAVERTVSAVGRALRGG